MEKPVESHLKGEIFEKMTRVTTGLCLYKDSGPSGLSVPATVFKWYIHVLVHVNYD